MKSFSISNFNYVAQAYECGTYGAEAFGETSCETSAASSGGLAYTGISVYSTLTVGVILIVLAIVVFVSQRKKQKRK
jgi:hypothetical protein